MKPLRARVRDGRLKLDEPTDLPEGTELELVPLGDDWDDLDDEDRRRLDEALAASEEDVKAGRVVPWEEVLAGLARARR
jgi:hypothetical protein